MRILALDLGPDWRGGQRQSALLARGLAERGHQVALLSRAGSPLARDIRETPRAARAAQGSLVLEEMPGGPESSPELLVAVARVARGFRPEIVYAGDSRGHGAAVWSRAAAERALVVHRRVVFPAAGNVLSRMKYRAADRFLAVSGSVAASLRAADIPEEKIAVVSDGLPPEAYVAAEPRPAPPFRLVHVGAFDGRKGQEIVVSVVSRLSSEGLDVEAVFLGDGPERARVEKGATAAGVEGRCAFLGEVRDVPLRLAASHVLLLPSDSEGAPLALVEAMAAGCPVVAHDVGGVSELVRGGEAGILIAGRDEAAWAAAVGGLLRAPARREALVRAGRTAAKERTIARTLDRVEEELTAVLEARRA